MKEWLIQRATEVTDKKGNRYYTRVFSGDSQPLDIRAGKYSFKYRPDVVLDRKGQLLIIEIAQWEDWRAWVGEMAIVRGHHPTSAIYFVFFDSNKEEVDSIARVISAVLSLDQCSYA